MLRKDEFWLTEVKEKLLDNPQLAVMRENKWLIFKLAKQIRDFSGVYKYIVGGEQGLYKKKLSVYDYREGRNKFIFNEQRNGILEQNQVHFSGLHFTAFQLNKTFGYLPSHGALF